MRFSISDFERKIAQGKQAREDLTKEINDLLRQESELKAAALACADAGDVDGYQQKDAAAARVTATIFVKRRMLDKLGPTVTADDARAAWADYAAKHNKALKASLDAFNDEKKKLCGMFADLLSLQGEALSVRTRLAAAVGLENSEFGLDFIPVRGGISAPGLLKLNGFNAFDPDACYYLSSYAIEHNKSLVPVHDRDPEVERVYSVLIQRS